MKKYLVTTALALSLGAFGLAAPASAQTQETPWFIANPENLDASVEVYAEVDKEQDKYVFELQLKLKLALVVVFQFLHDNTAAESIVVVEQENFDNVLTNNNNEEAKVFLASAMAGSVNRNTGVTQVNIDVGNGVNQGNVLAVAFSRRAAFADALAAAEQFTVNNSVTIDESIIGDFEPQKTISISNSINGNRGVTQVNTNVGNWNNQLNAVSIAVGGQSKLAMSEALLGQTTANNTVNEVETVRTTTITDSMNRNTGITSANTATGNMNNQATVISIAGSARF